MKNGRLIYPTRIETTLLLQGLAAIAEQVADEMGIECYHSDVSTVKKQLAGFGGADKADMMYVARKVGLLVTVSDEADAFGVFLVGIRELHPHATSAKWDSLIWGSRGSLL